MSEYVLIEGCERCDMVLVTCTVCDRRVCKGCAFRCEPRYIGEKTHYACSNGCTTICEICDKTTCKGCGKRCGYSYIGNIPFGGCDRVMCQMCSGGSRQARNTCRICQSF
jgi:hypothetical protein